MSLARRVCLSCSLCDGEAASRSIDGDRRPTVPVLVTQMDEQCAVVVLDAQAMPRVLLVMEPPDPLSGSIGFGKKRRPATAMPRNRHVGIVPL
jgi:hypothetical protein